MAPVQPRTKRPTKIWADISTGERIRGLTVLAIGASIFLGIIGTIVNSFSYNSGTPPSAINTSSTQTQTSQPTQSTHTTTAQQLASWYSKYGYIFMALENDLDRIGSDGKNTEAAIMTTDCKHLQTDVTTAHGLPAIPDAQIASKWHSGITYLSGVARDCIDGTANYNANLISKAATEISEANSKIVATNNDIQVALIEP